MGDNEEAWVEREFVAYDFRDEDLSRLRNAAIDSLRDVGTEESIHTLRKARLGAGMTMTLRQLSFDVAEDIYWQLTGGLSKESFDGAANANG